MHLVLAIFRRKQPHSLPCPPSLPYPPLSYLTLPCPTLPSPVLPYPPLSYLTLPCPTLPPSPVLPLLPPVLPLLPPVLPLLPPVLPYLPPLSYLSCPTLPPSLPCPTLPPSLQSLAKKKMKEEPIQPMDIVREMKYTPKNPVHSGIDN